MPRLMAGRAFRFKSSPLVPRGCGLSTAIPHADAGSNKHGVLKNLYEHIATTLLHALHQHLQRIHRFGGRDEKRFTIFTAEANIAHPVGGHCNVAYQFT